jgi:HSP20 family protein
MNALALRTPVFGGTLSTIEDEIDSLFRSPWHWPRATEVTTNAPVDIQETDDGYRLSFDLPGISKKDVSVEVKDGVITVSGERKREETKKEGSYTYRERSFGSFSRSFRLPENVKESEVSAKMNDGILEVNLLKAPEAKPKSIEIK